MSEINDICNGYVAQYARLSPMGATLFGVQGDPTRLDDLSPDGLAANDELAADTLRAVRTAEPNADDEFAREVIEERLEVQRDIYESGWQHANLNVIDSPLQNVRLVFDLMPKTSDDDVEMLAARMAAVPAALSGYRESLLVGKSGGRISALRQVDKCAAQCDAYAGIGGIGFFAGLADSVETEGTAPGVRKRLAAAARAADAAYAELGDFLRTALGPHAPESDAVGRERYELASRDFLGAAVDLEETYAWGWSEFLAIEAQMREVAERISPGTGPAGAAAALDADPVQQISGQDRLREWMQEISDRAIADLGQTHFHIPDPLRKLECLIAPPGAGVGAYYTGPSDDLTRPGQMWWSVEPGREVFPTWREKSVVYHEGVPGHHLQIGTAVCNRAKLNDYQRLLAGTSAHAEGWALYAEQLVRELGYLTDDAQLLGLLDNQLLRAARVVLDIGMHLELQIPSGTGFYEGERWTGELGLEFMLTRTITDPAYCRDEIDRYLGWPGQAPSYKIGERYWIAGRDAAQRRRGAEFDFKAFHTAALELGGMGLRPLERILATL